VGGILFLPLGVYWALIFISKYQKEIKITPQISTQMKKVMHLVKKIYYPGFKCIFFMLTLQDFRYATRFFYPSFLMQSQDAELEEKLGAVPNVT
jgi:hypothetical protein